MRSNRSARAILEELTTEAEFQAQVLELARYCGYLTYHTRDSRGSQGGWPDLACCRAGRPLILAELKRERGRLTPEQQQWIEVLNQATGISVAVWRPSDWDYIERTLKGAQRERPTKPE